MRYFYLAFFTLFSLSAQAQELGLQDRQVAACEATPSLSVSRYPGAKRIHPSNRLVRAPGKSIAAEGQIIYIYGRVFDEGCVPLTQARVELWHADPFGKYDFANDAELATPDPLFTGSGSATTDNLGQFVFITVYPGGAGKTAPHLNFRITHPEVRTFTTRIYFAQDWRNEKDPALRWLKEDKKNRVMADVQYQPASAQGNPVLQSHIDITVRGKQDFRGF